MTLSEILNEKLKEYLINKTSFPIYSIGIFGSFGTQRFNPQTSDIDLLIRYKPLKKVSCLQTGLGGTTSIEAIQIREELSNYLKHEVLDRLSVHVIPFFGKLKGSNEREKILTPHTVIKTN